MRAPLLLAAVTLGLMLVQLWLVPAPAAAGESRTAADPWSGLSVPSDRALTGSVAHLRAPRSKMILVLGGIHRMGSTPGDTGRAALDCPREMECRPDWFQNEIPAHRVKLARFWLDRTEVTVKDYQRCVELRRCEAIPYHLGARRFDRPNYPASLVTWQQAHDYCSFRNARLPTEAEYERASRGEHGRRYPWGKLFNSRATNHGRGIGMYVRGDWLRGIARTDGRDGHVELAEVGSLPHDRTPEGFMDLAGNVAEWTSDTYEDYRPDAGLSLIDLTRAGGESNISASAKAQPGANRTVRGGDYEAAAPWLRGAARRELDPQQALPTLGFRCARSAVAQERLPNAEKSVR